MLIEKGRRGVRIVIYLKSVETIFFPMKIFLIGFMGSGKTYWGKIWAEKNNLSFFDLDIEIEKSMQLTITEIFETKGEQKFREIESEYLRKFEGKNNFLLACGGGTPCFLNNLKWMKSQGRVIYLEASPEKILKNLRNETGQRPVIKNIPPEELLVFIRKKISERELFYSAADEVLNVDELDENVLSILLE